jgi:hypothetical protein
MWDKKLNRYAHEARKENALNLATLALSLAPPATTVPEAERSGSAGIAVGFASDLNQL